MSATERRNREGKLAVGLISTSEKPFSAGAETTKGSHREIRGTLPSFVSATRSTLLRTARYYRDTPYRGRAYLFYCLAAGIG